MASSRSRWRSRHLSTRLTPSRSYQAARGASVSRASRVAVSTMLGTLSAIETSQQCSPNPPGQEQDEDHENGADDEGPRFGDDGDAVLEQEAGGRAHEGAEERTGGSTQGRDDDLRRRRGRT